MPSPFLHGADISFNSRARAGSIDGGRRRIVRIRIEKRSVEDVVELDRLCRVHGRTSVRD